MERARWAQRRRACGRDVVEGESCRALLVLAGLLSVEMGLWSIAQDSDCCCHWIVFLEVQACQGDESLEAVSSDLHSSQQVFSSVFDLSRRSRLCVRGAIWHGPWWHILSRASQKVPLVGNGPIYRMAFCQSISYQTTLNCVIQLTKVDSHSPSPGRHLA